MPYASFLIFPLTDGLPKQISRVEPQHKVSFKAHPKVAILEVIAFGLEAGYITEGEVRRILESARYSYGKKF